jgi:hypothetical protein
MRAAGACIHTHSQNAGTFLCHTADRQLNEPCHLVMLTLQLPRNATSFRISHQEMIKGVRIGGVGKTLKFYDTLEVPIIENTADEEDLTFGMAAVGHLQHNRHLLMGRVRRWRNTLTLLRYWLGGMVSTCGVSHGPSGGAVTEMA